MVLLIENQQKLVRVQYPVFVVLIKWVRIFVGAHDLKNRSTVDVERFLTLIRFENRKKMEDLGINL